MNYLASRIGRLLSGSTTTSKLPALGDRELEVMKIFWQGNPLSAKQVLELIRNDKLSLSTMQSILERLYRKQLLHREKAGRYFVYRAAVSRTQIISQLLGNITDQLCDGDVAPLISGFSNYYNEASSEATQDSSDKEIGTLAHSNDD